MANKVNLELVDLIVSKVTDKFTDAFSKMMTEFSKCITETLSSTMKSFDGRLEALERRVSASVGPTNTMEVSASIAEAVTKCMVEFETRRAEEKTKSLNVIVSGLPPESDRSDKDLFEGFCEENLTVKPRVVRTRRLRKSTDNTAPAKLCITLDNPDAVNNLIESSSILRRSERYRGVFVNRDLTKAQADAAYKARCDRRDARHGTQSGGGENLSGARLGSQSTGVGGSTIPTGGADDTSLPFPSK
jgi:hypothetical protein